jgi:hypothetical protein
MLSYESYQQDSTDYTVFTYKGCGDVTKYDYINWIGVQSTNVCGLANSKTVTFQTPLEYVPMVYAQYWSVGETYVQVQVLNVTNQGFEIIMSADVDVHVFWIALKQSNPPLF